MRFSLRTLLAVMLLASLGCAVLFALPGPVGVASMLLLLLILPALCVLAIVYGRNEVRACGIGAVSGLFGNVILMQGLYSYSMVLETVADLLTLDVEYDDIHFAKVVLSLLLGSCAASAWVGLLTYSLLRGQATSHD